MDYFKIKWEQQSADSIGGQSVTQTYKIGTDDAVQKIQPLNSNWNSAGCYAGALAQNGSLMGSSSTLSFTGWNRNYLYSDLRDFQVQSSIPSGQQNLRFMAKFTSSGSYQITHQAFNWTNLTDNLVDKINEGFQQLSSQVSGIYDPYKVDFKNISISGNSNTPLNVAPLNSLKINDLIFVPYFIIKSVEYYDYNSDMNAYNSRQDGNVGIYTWSQVKNLDKTPAGDDYNNSLFEVGYENDPNTTHQDGVKFNYCCGCVLVPYYGKSSKTYNSSSDTYIDGLNPDDGKVYSSREVLGSINSDTDEFPIVYSSSCPRPNLIVLTEFKSSTTGGTIYSTPAGIVFYNATPNVNSIVASDFGLNPNWALDGNYQKFSTAPNWSPFFFTGNQTTQNYYKDYNPDDQETPPPDLVITSTHLNFNNDRISVLDPETTLNGGYFYLQDGPVATTWSKNQRNVNGGTCAYFSIKELWATIASLGCYVADNATCAQNAPTGAYTGPNNHLYLGQMNSNGITTGIMLQGDDLINSTQSRIDDIIQDTPYTPVDPEDEGGGDGEYPGPNPSGENQPDYKGDSIPGRTGRGNLGNIGASATYYVLSDNLMGNFNDKLWGQPSDFYEALQFTLNATPSIFDYIISCTYYPLNLSGYKGSAQEVYMGTGAKFGLNEYVLNTLSINLDFGSISLSDSIFHPYTDGEAFLNLSPYTQISITLPYAGSYDLNASEVAGGTLSLEGDLSFITGKMTYTLTLTTPQGASYPILKHSAKIGCDMKLSGADGSRQAASMVGAGINWAKSLMGAGSSLVSTGTAAASGDVIGMVSGMADSTNKILDFTQDTANLALASKEIPLQVGNSDGFDAIFSTQSAFITVYRPKLSNPPNYGHATGYLTEGTSTIGSLSGFTVCRNPDLKGFSAMDEEKAEIQQILTTGFYA